MAPQRTKQVNPTLTSAGDVQTLGANCSPSMRLQKGMLRPRTAKHSLWLPFWPLKGMLRPRGCRKS